MKCNLIIEINELTVRDYTIVEDEGIRGLIAGRPELKMSYEDDEGEPGRYMIVIVAPDLKSILNFLDFSEILVRILT